MSNGHAILAPSSASRWLTCTPSARLEEKFEDRAGEAAEEGTLVHKIAEVEIAREAGKISVVEYSFAISPLINDKLYKPEMKSYVEDYKDYVLEQFEFMKVVTGDAVLCQEIKLDMSDYVPEGTGTADVGIIGDGEIHGIDLKYGKGVRVEAKNNKQLMLYALGLLKEFDGLYKIDRVKMTIYQPRIDNISSFVLTVAELKQWAETELKPKAELAFKGEGDFVIGEHCQFCKARAVCVKQADYQLQVLEHDFKDPVLLDDEAISDILTRQKSLLSWLKTVSDYALLSAVQQGKKWPGLKLVEGRSNRKYSDEKKVVDDILFFTDLKEDALYKKELFGITAMKGIVGNKNFTTLIEPLLVKPPGSPTLVSEDDERPELNSLDAAKRDFKIENDNED